ncbi:hypothetical protein BJY01DRAFT_227702 [Aspergillus pseudoustus]|uniref:Uncharacterized protein n=1 Tax=Aspergillus pseudoustus TaxID=1810923 RepID=A0ABR4IQ00_9EURO
MSKKHTILSEITPLLLLYPPTYFLHALIFVSGSRGLGTHQLEHDIPYHIYLFCLSLISSSHQRFIISDSFISVLQVSVRFQPLLLPASATSADWMLCSIHLRRVPPCHREDWCFLLLSVVLFLPAGDLSL